MRGNLRSTLATTAAVLMFASAQAQDRTTVTAQGFCITRTEMRCEEVALPGATVAYNRLPKLADGTRVIYFYSDQSTGGTTIVVHMLEAEDFDPGVKFAIPKALQSQAESLTRKLKGVAERFSHGGMVLVSPVQAASTGPKPGRAFSQIVVEGPGAFSGQVVDQNGAPVPGSERVSFLVTRGPASDQPKTAPGSGMKSYDADG